jgi:hypothetical protein
LSKDREIARDKKAQWKMAFWGGEDKRGEAKTGSLKTSCVRIWVRSLEVEEMFHSVAL